MDETGSKSTPSVILPAELVKSRKRVIDHGEVFTPPWMVEEMLNLVKDDSERIDSRFLEPACGSGNFLNAVLKRKFSSVEKRYGMNLFEKRNHALFSLMCIYGIELLEDNIIECRNILLSEISNFLNLDELDPLFLAASKVLVANIIQGDALTLRTSKGLSIEFPEWGYLGLGKFQRRDFKFDTLTLRSGAEGTLFELFEEHELFTPTKVYPKMDINELAK